MIFGFFVMGFGFNEDDSKQKIKGLTIAISGALILALIYAAPSMTVPNTDSSGNRIDQVGTTFQDGTAVEALELTNPIAKWIPMFGFMTIMFGVVQLYFSIKEDDAGKKQLAITEIATGVVVWQLVNILNWILGIKM